MNKFKALMKKDWLVNKKTFLVPIWIVLAFYALTILAVIIARFRGDLNIIASQLTIESISEFDLQLNFLFHSLLVVFPGLMAVVFTLQILQNSLNEDIRRNCEIFHSSQPASYLQRAASKFTVGIGGNWAVLFAIVLFNFVVANIILAAFGVFHFSSAFSGMFVSLLGYMKVIIVLGSLAFFFSAIFKEAAFFKGLVIILAINVLFSVLNYLMNWNLPLPFSYIHKLVFTQSAGTTDMTVLSGAVSYMDLFRDKLDRVLFNWQTVYQLAFSAVLFFVGTYLYREREIL